MQILFYLFTLLFSSPFVLSGQKKFNVTIDLSGPYLLDKLKIYLDNGKGQTLQNPILKNNKLHLEGEYFSEYAGIIFRYPRLSNLVFQNSFFLTDKPASIKLIWKDSSQSPFEHYKLKNAFDFAIEKKKMKEFDSLEVNKSQAYLIKYMDRIFSGKDVDSAIANKFFQMDQLIYRKDLEYIFQNSNSYYSFWYFRRNIAPGTIIPVDSALHIFTKIFPDKFKFSEEGEYVYAFMLGRINVKKGGNAPEFYSQAINGASISLQKIVDTKYVLLNFWATWCVPCIKEIPVLQEIHQKYTQDVAIISVSYDSDYTKYLEMINREKMDWTNIFNDIPLINSYGGNLPIPRTYLIDKTRKIIYEAFVDDFGDSRLSNLQRLLATISSEK